ncbi:uncharacterized protein V6R79_000459 [Siganus canaliculatus]
MNSWFVKCVGIFCKEKSLERENASRLAEEQRSLKWKKISASTSLIPMSAFVSASVSSELLKNATKSEPAVLFPAKLSSHQLQLHGRVERGHVGARVVVRFESAGNSSVQRRLPKVMVEVLLHGLSNPTMME